MSLMIALKGRSFIVSLMEMLLFFFVITPIYFLLAAFVCALLQVAFGKAGSAALWPNQWPAHMAIWMWLAATGGYLILVTFYWFPGDDAANDTELRAFTAMLVLVAVSASLAVAVMGSLAALLGWLGLG